MNEDQKKTRFRKSLEKKSEPLAGAGSESDELEGLFSERHLPVSFSSELIHARFSIKLLSKLFDETEFRKLKPLLPTLFRASKIQKIFAQSLQRTS